jgi:transcriptional regulator with XRE-family HTH domain
VAKDIEYRSTFTRNLSNRIRQAGVTQKQLADATGISPSALSSYVQGVRYPRPEYVTALANYFGIEPGELTEDTDKREAKASQLSDEALRIGETFDQLDPLGKEVIRFVIDVELQRTRG